MPEKKKTGRDFPLANTPTPKPMQDSGVYYNNLAKKYYNEANKVINAPYGGSMLSDQWKERNEKESNLYKKASEATNNALRQSRKGKPGYDAMGFPKKP